MPLDSTSRAIVNNLLPLPLFDPFGVDDKTTAKELINATQHTTTADGTNSPNFYSQPVKHFARELGESLSDSLSLAAKMADNTHIKQPHTVYLTDKIKDPARTAFAALLEPFLPHLETFMKGLIDWVEKWGEKNEPTLQPEA